MNTKHLVLAVTFGIGMLAPAYARAQDSVATTARLTAKLRSSSALPHSSVLDRGRPQRLVTVSERAPTRDKPEHVGRGELVEALIRWTDRLVNRLDPLGMLETPFQPAPSVDSANTPSPVPREWKPIPRLRPVQLPGGYGLVARIIF